MPRSARCSSCPATSRKRAGVSPMQSYLLHEETIWPSCDSAIQRQERALREAIAPYICVDELRRLAAQGEDMQKALRNREALPEEVHALFTLLKVILSPRADERMLRSSDIAALLMLQMGTLDHEEFWLACLDMKNHVQCLTRVYKGSLNSSVVRIAEVFRLPMQLNSAAIVVAHSHPSGVVTPSEEDIATTRALVQAGALLQIEVLDHLIIGQGTWLSMRDRRMGGWELV